MAEYTLSLTGDVIQARLAAILTIQSQITDLIQAKDELYDGVGDLVTANGRRIEEINDLQSDVRYIRAAIDMIGPGSGGGTSLSIQALTQEAYDNLSTKDATTLYIII